MSIASISNAMVNGAVHPIGLPRYPAAINIKNWCGATKIGPRTFITAAHCVFDYPSNTINPIMAKGATIEITANPLPAFGVGFESVTIEFVEIAPKHRAGCAAAPCDFGSMLAAGPDVAIFRVNRTTPLIQTAAIDYAPVPDGTALAMTGAGCEDYNNLSVRVPSDQLTYPFGRLSYHRTSAEPAATVAPTGVSYNPAHEIYTAGYALNAANAGLCEGDSGGGLFYDDSIGLTLLGVNSARGGSNPILSTSATAINFHARLSALQSWITPLIK